MIINTYKISALHIIRATSIFVVYCCQFVPSWILGLKMEKFCKYLLSLMLSYKIRKNTDFLRCTTNQVSTGHKLHFQPIHPVRAKLAAINNNYGGDTVEVWYRHFRNVSYHWYYYIRSLKTQLRSVVPPTKPEQAISSVFRPDIQLGPNWQQSTTKKAVAQLMCNSGSSEFFHIVDIVI